MILINIKFEKKNYKASLSDEDTIAKLLVTHLPLDGEARNIGGEIFFRVDNIDVPFDGTEREEFDIGDIVYWRSPKGEKKFAIAIFYGNTKFSDWKTPRAAGHCVKIGRIASDVSQMEDIESGENVRMEVCS